MEIVGDLQILSFNSADGMGELLLCRKRTIGSPENKELDRNSATVPCYELAD